MRLLAQLPRQLHRRRPVMRLAATMAILASLLAPHAAADGAPQGVSAFAAADFTRQIENAARRMAAPAEAAATLEALTAAFPASPDALAGLAMARAAAGDADGALEALGRAVAQGFAAAPLLTALPPFAGLGADPRLAALAAREPGSAPQAPLFAPAPVRGGVAPVGEANARWRPSLGVVEIAFAFPDAPGAPLLGQGERDTPAGRALMALARRGLAAGLRGDVYDNRDRGHSRLGAALFPQLAATVYAPEAVAAEADYGLNLRLDFDATVIGNASIAVTGGPLWRSMPRLALTTPGGPARLARLYDANHLYVFPEHRDHDPDRGDMFAANTPYVLIVKGSSGSDRPFLRALAYALAALRPDAKARLRAEGLIAPTLQMLLRRTARGVSNDADYLSGAAHPTVFVAADIDIPRLIAAAAALRADALPPAARIAIIEEGPAGPGDAGGAPETLFDTPSAVARIARGSARDRRYRLSAAATIDPNDRPLRFHWRLLRGDPAEILIEPLGPDGREAEVRIGWTAPQHAPGAPKVLSSRVDVAVFADNGASLSAPAIFSLTFPAHERRIYAPDGRLLSIDRVATDRSLPQADPVLFPQGPLREEYRYDAAGRLVEVIASPRRANGG